MNLIVSYRKSPTTLVAGSLPSAGIPVTIVDPWGNNYPTTSGSKPEHGPGGFELIIPTPALGYHANIEGQDFLFEHKPGLTFLSFVDEYPPNPEPPPEPPPPPPPDPLPPEPEPPPPDPCPHDPFQAALLGYLAIIAQDVEIIKRCAYWLYLILSAKEDPAP